MAGERERESTWSRHIGFGFCAGTLANLIPSNKVGWTDTHLTKKEQTRTLPRRYSQFLNWLCLRFKLDLKNSVSCHDSQPHLKTVLKIGFKYFSIRFLFCADIRKQSSNCGVQNSAESNF